MWEGPCGPHGPCSLPRDMPGTVAEAEAGVTSQAAGQPPCMAARANLAFFSGDRGDSCSTLQSLDLQTWEMRTKGLTQSISMI